MKRNIIIVAFILVLAFAVKAQTTLVYDPVAYAQMLDQYQQMLKEYEKTKQMLEYYYKEIQMMEAAVKNIDMNDLATVLNGLNATASGIQNIKSMTEGYYITIGDKKIYIKDLGTTPEAAKTFFDKLESAEWTNEEERRAWETFGFNAEFVATVEDAQKIANSMAEMMTVKANEVAENEDVVKALEDRISEQLLTIGTDNSEKARALALAEIEAQIAYLLLEMKQIIALQGGLEAQRYNVYGTTGMPIGISVKDEATRQYGVSEDYISSDKDGWK